MSQCKVINLGNWGKELSEETHLMKGGEGATLKFVPQLIFLPLIPHPPPPPPKKKTKFSVYRKVVGIPNPT